MKVYIGTGRSIGEKCIAWARGNLPPGVELVDDPEECNIFISVLYPKLLTKKFLENHYALNFHPGILPEYRGSGTCSWVIVNGEKQAGVTLHVIDEGIDTGPIIEIVKFNVGPDDTAGSVFTATESIIEYMFKKWFAKLLTENITMTAQPAGGHTYYRKDLDKLKDVTNIVRALTFTGKEQAYFRNKDGEKIYLDYYDTAS